MGPNTKELMLEILSEESPPSLTPLLDNSYVKGNQPNSHADDIPSPFKGEGKSEGKDHESVPGVVVGVLKDINAQDQPLVDFHENPLPLSVQARSTVPLGKADIGQDVVLMFERGDLRKPIIMGILFSTNKNLLQRTMEEELEQIQPTQVELDGERLTFTGSKEIVLKCGKASITLTKAGKIIIKGEYLLNRASGVNRIQGGSVQIN